MGKDFGEKFDVDGKMQWHLQFDASNFAQQIVKEQNLVANAKGTSSNPWAHIQKPM